MEQKKQRAQALIFGPIEDAGQLSLALLINELAGESGWLMVTGKELYRMARLSERAGRNKLNQLVEMGVVEWQKKPPQGLRLKTDDRHQVPLDRQEMPLQLEQDHRHQMPLERQEMPLDRHDVPLPNPSAYLPLKDINTNTTTTEDRGVQGGETEPTTNAPNQPAAQPPAVVGQGELLPTPAKPKRKRKAKGKATPIASDWEPDQDTIDYLASQGVPAEFALASVWEFRRFWLASGGKKIDWGATFANNTRKIWGWELEREKRDEQKAKQRERFTDASGRPISAKERAAEDILDAAFKPLPSDQPAGGGAAKPLDIGQLSTADLARLLD